MKVEYMVSFLATATFISTILSTDQNFMIHKDETDASNVVYLFAHGLGATGKGQANIYCKDKVSNHPYPESDNSIISKPLITFDFPDAKNDDVEYDSKKVNLGQQLDIDCLYSCYKKGHEEFPESEVILCGVSRGAVTILNMTALHSLEAVRALIVESPFDTIHNPVVHFMSQYYLNWLPFSKKIGLGILKKKFPLISLKGPFPINLVRDIPKDLPIMLIHSRKDKVCPIDSSRRLYIELIQTGHTNVYYLELASGEHARLLCGPEGELYQNIIHAFYERYGLPLESKYASKARHLLSYCQPTIEFVERNIKQHRIPDEFREEMEELEEYPSHDTEASLEES